MAPDLSNSSTTADSAARSMDERVYAKSRYLNDKIPRSKRLNFENQELKDIDGVSINGKAQEMNLLSMPEPNDYTAVINMGLIWRLATPRKENREKPNGSKYTWEDYAQQLVQLMLSRHLSLIHI